MSSITPTADTIASLLRWPTNLPMVTYSPRPISSRVIAAICSGGIRPMTSLATAGVELIATSARNPIGSREVISTARPGSSSPATRAESTGPNTFSPSVATNATGNSRLAAASRDRAGPWAVKRTSVTCSRGAA